MTRRPLPWFAACTALIMLAIPVTAQQPAPATANSISQLSAFDYPTRMNAARQLRRIPQEQAFPALTAAVSEHSDQFVRARALVLLSGFGPVGVSDVMQKAMSDRNDRLREVAYRWFELHPEPRLAPALLAALNTEQAEFVRPALVRAVAAVGTDPQVQRALIVEAGRGLDFFRSPVIDALGWHRAAYAAEAIAAISKLEGPLQDDAVLALGRIGGTTARSTLATFTDPPLELIPALQAALCFVDDACTVRLEVLRDTVRSRAANRETVRAAVRALGEVASAENPGAVAVLAELAGDGNPAIVGDVAVALATAAVRRPPVVIGWLLQAPGDVRARAITLLKEGFESLEEDFAEEQFYAAARTAYWAAPENSPARTLAATLIDTLEF
jgi:hypothetical protein